MIQKVYSPCRLSYAITYYHVSRFPAQPNSWVSLITPVTLPSKRLPFLQVVGVQRIRYRRFMNLTFWNSICYIVIIVTTMIYLSI